jgi:hypothetical protein
MRLLWPFLSAIACASVMLVCMRLMHDDKHAAPETSEHRTPEIEDLRAEVQDLRSRLDSSYAIGGERDQDP